MPDESSAEQREAIFRQILVAFGQGTGPMRVSRAATAKLHERYHGWVDERVAGQWDDAGSHILERMRAIGRMAASSAASAGRTVITDKDVEPAMHAVERQSSGGTAAARTDLCPPPPG